MSEYLYAVEFLGNVGLIAAESDEKAVTVAHRDVREAFGQTNYEAFQIYVRPATNDDLDWALDTHGIVPEGELLPQAST